MNKTLIGACFVASLSAAPAFAVSFHFDDLTPSGTVLNSNDMAMEDGVMVTAFAGRYDGISSPNEIVEIDSGNRDVAQTPGVGLGVTAPFIIFPDNNQDEIDGLGDELLTLSFDNTLFEASVVFSGFEATDSVDIFINGDLAAEEVTGVDLTTGFFDLSGFGQFTTISFGADAIGRSADEFGIAKFSAEVVPLPAAAWMLLAGVGGLAAMRRRKKS